MLSPRKPAARASSTDGKTTRYSFVSGLSVNTDDVIRVVTASGGGYGDPAKRDPNAVRRDIGNGLISPERAKEVYGVS